MGREARKAEQRMQFSPEAVPPSIEPLRVAVEEAMQELDRTLQQKRELRACATRLLRRLTPAPD